MKFDNLFYKEKNSFHLVIAGFSLASLMTNSDKVKEVCGTPGFIAPEVFTKNEKSEDLSKRDIFSAGVLFYTLLTGSALF